MSRSDKSENSSISLEPFTREQSRRCLEEECQGEELDLQSKMGQGQVLMQMLLGKQPQEREWENQTKGKGLV